MTAFIYLQDSMRENLKKAISVYVNLYTDKVSPTFDNIDTEAHEEATSYYNKIGGFFNPDRDDPAQFAERAWEHGLEHWQALTLFQYNTKMMTIATLYQVWEQQIRQLAYKELTRHHALYDKKNNRIEFSSFCTKFHEIEDMLKKCGVDITSLASWGKINELRHLQNVIKHGDGVSANELEELRPQFFAKVGSTRLMDLYLTTLNEKVLDVDDSEFVAYGDAINLFWDELPERMYFNP